MREYDIELVQRLLEKGKEITVHGVRVECKPVPDGDGRPALDPRVLRIEESMLGMSALDAALGAPDLETMRDNMVSPNYNLNRAEIRTRYHEIPTSVGTVPVWEYYPRKRKTPGPVLIYAHGGAFMGGSPFMMENSLRLLAERSGCTVWNVDYSLPPEHPYPIPCTQIYEVSAWVRRHSAELGIDRKRIVVSGDSCGGNMAAAAVQMDRDRGTGIFRAQILLYPKLTFTNYELPGYRREESAFEIVPEQARFLPGLLKIGSDEYNASDERFYVQGRYPITEPYISPAFGEKEGLPRTLLLLAEYDGLRLEGEFYALQLYQAGVPVRVIRYCGIEHGFFGSLGILPQAEAAVEEMAALFREPDLSAK